ncbi:hemicentin-1-like isoform X2 [Acropora muricata]
MNAELNCNFSLTTDLRLITVSVKFGITPVATYLRSQQALSVVQGFRSRFNATWVPSRLTLILLNVTSADEGEYLCEVVTFGRSVYTWVRKIHVSLIDGGSITWYDPPVIETVTTPSSISSANKSLIKGSMNAELNCNFSLTTDLRLITVSMKFGITPVATYLRSQQALSVVQGFRSRFNATWVPSRLTLILLTVTSADEGEYLCEVMAFGRSVYTWVRKIQVSLLVKPRITEIAGKTVTEGDNVTLKCLAEGKPTPIITWTRLSDNSVVTMPLINISRRDVTLYRCTADNGVGTPATGHVVIDVQYPVEAIGFGENATVLGGGAKNFSCPVDGNPKPNITWYRGSEVSGKPICYEEKFEARESGCCTCTASNSLGQSISITQCLEMTKFVDESDRKWYTRNQQFVSLNQDGPISGHYMQVDGDKVLTNALGTNQKSLFKVHSILEQDSNGGYHELLILENQSGRIVAIDRENDKVIAKAMVTEDGVPTSPSQFNTLADVKQHHPDALFYKIPREKGSDYFYLKSFLADKQRILGFNEYGIALDPTQVQPNQEQSLFTMV